MLKRKLELIEQHQSFYGDGEKWCRGSMIGKGNSAKVFLANLKKPKLRTTHHNSIMAVKSAKYSNSDSIYKERLFLDNLQGCPFILESFGEEITISKDGEKIYNLLLEYGSGGTLAERIKNVNGGKGLLEEEVSFFTKCMLSGLEFIHARGYIHRDLKPENIMLMPNHMNESVSLKYMAKIGDFGSAKNVKKLRKMKIEPYLRGNVKYLSPASMVANKQSYESDIWAVGCIVFEMLTGKTLWDEMNDLEIENALFKIGLGHEKFMVEVPGEVSQMAKEFLVDCLGNKTKKIWSAEMLLKHPFIIGQQQQ